MVQLEESASPDDIALLEDQLRESEANLIDLDDDLCEMSSLLLGLLLEVDNIHAFMV